MVIETRLITQEKKETGIIRPTGLTILHGAAGSGKGTCGEKVAELMTAAGIKTIHFASGDALREKYDPKSNDPIERELAAIKAIATPFMKRGELVPVAPMTRLIALRLKQIEDAHGADEIILDGFPRSREQDIELRKLTGQYTRRDLLIDAIRKTAQMRAELRGREDDTPEAIARRMNLFYVDESQKSGILHMVYGIVMDINDGLLNSKFKRVNAEQDPEEVRYGALKFIIETSPHSNLYTVQHAPHGKGSGLVY